MKYFVAFFYCILAHLNFLRVVTWNTYSNINYNNIMQSTTPRPEIRRVIPLVDGSLLKGVDGLRKTASVTLIQANGISLVVDSAAATDFVNAERMLKNLAMLNVSHVNVRFFVTTHGHPDHFGQSNFFQNADHFFGAFQNHANHYKQTQLRAASTMHLTDSITLWSTPGHTTDDISVVVTDVENLGTIGVVGDLFYSEEDAISNGTEWMLDALNPFLGQHNRRKMICAVDYIVPGHSHMFRVTNEMKSKAGCQLSPSNSNIVSSKSNSLPTSIISFHSQQTPSPTVYHRHISAITGTNMNAEKTLNSAQQINSPTLNSYINSRQYSAPINDKNLTKPFKLNSLIKSPAMKFDSFPGNYNVMATPVQQQPINFKRNFAQNGLIDYLHATRPGTLIPFPDLSLARIFTKKRSFPV